MINPAAQLRTPQAGRRIGAGASAAFILAGAALALGVAAAVGLLPALAGRLRLFVTIFLGIFIEALPFLLLGVLASAAIQLFVPTAWVQRASPRNPVLAALLGATLGLCCLPVCECGTVPATRRLLAKGASPPLGIAFLLAAPAVNPVVIASTWVAFGGNPLFVFGRLGLTLATATFVGALLGSHPRPQELLVSSGADEAHAHCHAGRGRLDHFLTHAGDEFFEMGRFLVVGAALAASFQTLVPRAALLTLGQGAFVSVLALMALAVVLSICSTVDAFVALAFAGSFLPGATLAFLVFGPMIDIKSVLLFTTIFRRRTILLLVLLTAQLAFLGGVLVNLGYGG